MSAIVSSRFWLRVYRGFNRTEPRLAAGCVCFLLLALLECWHPLFFFGDDNMQFTFVHMAEVGRNLVHGENLFLHHYIFGGGFDMRDDSAFLSLWNPVILLCSLLTLTPCKFWAVDCVVGVYLVGAGVAMAHLLIQLRNLRYVRISNALVVFLSVSYALSGFSVLIGEAWSNFAANIAALPLFASGVLHPSPRRGALTICAAGLIGILAGHPDPLAYSLLFIFLFSASVCFVQKSFKPLAVLGIGFMLSVIITSPLLWEAWQGFKSNPRAGGLGTDLASHYSVPIDQAVAGYFGGWFAGWAVPPVLVFGLPRNGSLLFSASFSSLLIIAALARWKSHRSLSWICAALAGLALLLVQRPSFLAQGIAHVPVFASFKWPFRQLMLFHFFIVVWLAACLGRLPLRRAAIYMLGGLTVFSLSLLQLGRPAFNDFGDRDLVLSGRAEHFWNEIRRDIPPNAVFAVFGEPAQVFKWRYPLCLAGANNFPALYGVRMAGGYSFSRPYNSPATRIPCNPFFAFYDHNAIPALVTCYQSVYAMELCPPGKVKVGLLGTSYADFLKRAKTVDIADFLKEDGPVSHQASAQAPID